MVRQTPAWFKVKCRFCGFSRYSVRMFHWHGDVWECIDLRECEASERLRCAP